jgi:cell wall-associated NlpC family hydrolase
MYSRVGIDLAHSSFAQWDSGRHIGRSELRPGDLVFFAGLGHVGLYLGHGRFIHAPHSGTDVSTASLNAGWYAATYVGAVRVAGSQRRYRSVRVRSPKRAAQHLQAERIVARLRRSGADVARAGRP